ncbi:PAS domain-containing hybrid sensor histidine kinase/response regulator [Nocardioides litoris]|uniref:PAS domain-containing hybrid sensor histidine kinase/response regulator n=1 Tax=Nocardioides litoris TaxID=1926648 RepID=UPI0014776CC2|nr:PAS domain-containing hybrid sensor histidine kinase/response regulator [Nocardioides litoris]
MPDAPMDWGHWAGAASPDALCAFDLDGRVRWANPAFADLVGLSLHDVVGRDGADLGDHDGRSQFARHVEEMREGHPGARDEETLVVRADGSTRWCLVSWWPVPGPDGRPTAYVHRFHEHTEHRRLLEQLEQTQRTARVGGWIWDVPRNEVWWSREAYAVYGIEPETMVPTYEGFMSLVHPDDVDDLRRQVAAVVEAGEHLTFDVRMPTPTGDVRWIHGEAEVARDPSGAAVRLVGASQDITDRQQALEAATTATRRLDLLQQLAEAANRSTALADALVRSAQLIEESPEWTPLGVALKTHRGAPLSVLELPEPAAPGLPPLDLEAAAECWRTRSVVQTPLPDEGPLTVRLMSLPITNGHQMACVVQVLARLDRVDDFTWQLMVQVSDQLSRVAERERTAVQLEEARDAAMAASELKSEFLATMSHEIRTPMNGVVGLTDLLLRSGLDPEQRKHAEALRGAGLTLLALLNDILDLSKIESGRLELEQTEVDVRAVVEQTVHVVGGPARDKGLDLRVSVQPDVPRLLRGDPVRLGQVLANLGSNAVKFTDAGQVSVDVRLGAPPADDPSAARRVTLRVEVHDTGIGIDEADLDGLFDAFTQADRSTTRRHGGTGLGLAICRQLVEAMGGHLEVRSACGAGSVFWFEVPLEVADGAAAPEAPVVRRRVLVLAPDDDRASSLVERLGTWQLPADPVVDVDQARRAIDAAAAEGRPHDLVLVAMPGPDAVAASAALARAGVRHGVDLVHVGDPGPGGHDAVQGAGFAASVAGTARSAELYAAVLDATGGGTPGADRPARPPGADLGLHVLVVEDNAVNQLVATGLLENLGCTVATVDNGAEAVDALAPGHGVDLVLMDLRMPQLDGFDATRAVRQREQGTRVPIVAMTASALPGERERCLAAGMDDFLTKPVDPAQLAAAITRLAPRTSRATDRAATAAPRTDAASTARGDEAVLDPERVEMLSELVKDGVSFFERTRASFLARVDGMLAQVSIAVQDDDAERTTAVAHQLKGSAANLGVVRVAALAAQVEDAARAGRLDEAAAVLPALRAAVGEATEALLAAPPPLPAG